MSDTWRTYPHAPATGQKICHISDIADPDAVTFDMDGFPLLLVRRGKSFLAYVNACPHQFLPLDHKGRNILSADANMLRCTNHSAAFDVETGQGVEGFGEGCALDPVPVRLTEDHRVVIA